MSQDDYHKDRIANRKLHPETLMMGFGYSPAMSEGSLKPPVFLTSTFVFENAQQGKDFFDLTAGRRQLKPGEKSGLVYSRFNHPNMEILEDRLAIWDEADPHPAKQEYWAVNAAQREAGMEEWLALMRERKTLRDRVRELEAAAGLDPRSDQARVGRAEDEQSFI